MKKLTVLACIASFFVTATGVHAAGDAVGDAARGKTLYAVCVACHGATGEGNPQLNSPMIGGQEVWYVERQLRDFKAGIRGGDPKDVYGAQMRPMSMTLADDQAIADVAAYVGSLKATRHEATIEGDVDKGKAGYALCVPCHGAKGEGNVLFNSPRLAGQQDWYVVRQLENFKVGIRGTKPEAPFGMQMRPMAMTLVDDDAIRNIAAFIATLK